MKPTKKNFKRNQKQTSLERLIKGDERGWVAGDKNISSEIRALHKQGMSVEDIMLEVGCGMDAVKKAIKATPKRKPIDD